MNAAKKKIDKMKNMFFKFNKIKLASEILNLNRYDGAG